MSDVFISYARSTEAKAKRVEEALRALGYSVWRDDELPTHRSYAEVIEEQLRSAKAVVVLWSADALSSEWVRAEADVARKLRTLAQATLDGSLPPLPFNQIQCADLRGWSAAGHPGWEKIAASVAELLDRPGGQQAGSPSKPGVQWAPETIRIPVELRAIVMASGRNAGMVSGLNGELAKAMASLPSLRVLSARAGPADKELAYVLDGALQRERDQLRLAVRLLSSDGSILWSEKYDGSARDLFGFQERAATQVASNVDTIVRMREVERTTTVPDEELDARQLYYRAIGGLRRMERKSLREGERYAESLIELAPRHAHALAIAACIDLNVWMLGFADDGNGETYRKRASDRASRALSLSGDDHWVEALSAMVLAWVGCPIDVSISQLDRIRAAAPSFAPAWFWSGLAEVRAGHLATAISHLDRAIELEPLTPLRSTMASYKGAAQVVSGDFAAAVPLLAEGLRVRPQWTSLYIFSAVALASLGRIDEARRQLAISEKVAPVANSRWPTRDEAQRRLLCEGLTIAGIADAEPIFADVW